MSVHIDISVVIPEQCAEQARLWTVKVLRLACGCFWVYSSTNFTTGRKNVELLYQVTLTTFGATMQKVVKFERLFRLKEMFNRVTLTDETRHGPRNQSNGSTLYGVIHIDGQYIILHTIPCPRISRLFWHTTQGVLLSYPVPHGQTVNAGYHKFFLQYHLCRTAKRPDIL